MFHQFREYLITNIVYINMLDNVFDIKEIINYIFSVDYIYNFLQIKLIWNEENENKSKEEKLDSPNNSICSNNNENSNASGNDSKNSSGRKYSTFKPLFLEGEFKEMFTSEETSLSLVKLGMNFKKRQKFDYFSLNKQYENMSLYNSSNSMSDNYNNKSHNIRKGSFNFNDQSLKKKFLGNNSNHEHNDKNNYSSYKTKRKNTYTFGQGLKKYGYNNESNKIVVSEENESDIKEGRSDSYDKLGNNKKDENESAYKIQLNDSVDELKSNNIKNI